MPLGNAPGGQGGWAGRMARSAFSAAAILATSVTAMSFAGLASASTSAHSSSIATPNTMINGLTWHNLSLLNGWEPNPSVLHYTDSGIPAWAVQSGVVYLRGTMSLAYGVNSLAAVLPPAARPANVQDFVVFTANGSYAHLNILPDGHMLVFANDFTDASALTSLATVSFPAATTPSQVIPRETGWLASSGQGEPSFSLIGGVVHLQGGVYTPYNAGEQFAQLPSAARPSHNLWITVGNDQLTTAYIEIEPNGGMFSVNGQSLTTLSGITYPVKLTWHKLTLLNGWNSSQSTYYSGDPSYAVANGIVYLSGSLHQASGTNEEFAVLPAGERPTHYLYLQTYTFNGSVGSIEIAPDGEMWAWSPTATDAQNYTSLASISFPQTS